MSSALNRKRKYADAGRVAAIFLIFAVILFMLISTYFIAYEADHECTGDDCPVCALLHMSENNLRQLGSGAPAAAAVSSLLFFAFAMHVLSGDGIVLSTPVSRKTRLNN